MFFGILLKFCLFGLSAEILRTFLYKLSNTIQYRPKFQVLSANVIIGNKICSKEKVAQPFLSLEVFYKSLKYLLRLRSLLMGFVLILPVHAHFGLSLEPLWPFSVNPIWQPWFIVNTCSK